LSDPDFYKSAKEDISRCNERISTIETDLEKAYLRWEELEAIRNA
nr:ABC transporter ATP-binding protein [Gammaproteobacteria bacterium]NIR93222.1 ABC transporter ATP-binding protein [Gammaproteobacteria bacterium]